MGKRSYIRKDRLELLKSKDVVYLITCHQSEYYCKTHEDRGCQRGFFSLLLQAVYGIQFANKMNLPFYVDFGNITYSYSEGEKFNGNENFWEYYFEQTPLESNRDLVLNSKFENYPLKIWDRSFIRQLHQSFITNLILKKEIKESINSIHEGFKKSKVLGVHIRKTDHYLEVNPVKDASFFKLVDKLLSSFDKIFLATDDSEILLVFGKKYGDKLMFNSFSRSQGATSIHGKIDSSNGYELGKEALLDCYSLSFCDQVILSPSNLSYCALVLNPELPYQIAESKEAKYQRFKTLGAYYLNKWGIRKW